MYVDQTFVCFCVQPKLSMQNRCSMSMCVYRVGDDVSFSGFTLADIVESSIKLKFNRSDSCKEPLRSAVDLYCLVSFFRSHQTVNRIYSNGARRIKKKHPKSANNARVDFLHCQWNGSVRCDEFGCCWRFTEMRHEKK